MYEKSVNYANEEAPHPMYGPMPGDDYRMALREAFRAGYYEAHRASRIALIKYFMPQYADSSVVVTLISKILGDPFPRL